MEELSNEENESAIDTVAFYCKKIYFEINHYFKEKLQLEREQFDFLKANMQP